MATQRVETVVDDIDGTEGAERVVFSVDDQSYEIDLTDGNADKLREALTPYMQAGRRLSRSGRPYVRVDLDHAPKRRRRSNNSTKR